MVTLHVKTTAGKKFSIEIELESTVADAKTALVVPTEVPEVQQRLIYKGKVLKDELTLASYGIEAEHTIFFVRGSVPRPARPTASAETPAASAVTPPAATPAATPAPAAAAAANPFGFPLFPPAGGATGGVATNPFGGMFGAGAGAGAGGMQNMAAMQQQLMQNPEMMRQMMESPMMQGIMSNPEIMRSMMQSNPQIQQLMEQNPQLNHILNDPELLRQSMEAMRNPAAMREMMRNQDTAMRNIESHPEGFNALRRMYQDVQEPLMNAASSGAATSRGPAFTMPGVAGGGSQSANTTQTTPTTASTAPGAASANPWASSTPQNAANNPWAGGGMGGLGGMGGFGGMGGGAPNPEMMAQILQNPMFQPALEQIANNPELFISQMEQMNPQMSQMLNANPQLRQMMQNPEFLRAAMNPQNLQAMMQMQSAMNQLRSTGLVPGLEGLNLGGAPAGGSAAGGTNNAAAANPFAAFGGLGGFPLDFGNFGAAGGGAAATPAANPEELYASQLTQLNDMGFSNRDQNVRALQATQGNVHAAVERLLSGTF